MKVLSNITKVLFSSVITFSSNFIIGFILPIYLSVAEYGYYREFVLYFNFFYILNLGFNEGLYIKYGGKSLAEIDKDTLLKEHNTSLLFQFLVTLVILSIGIIQGSTLFIIFAITVFFSNGIYFHQLVQQALSEFTEYSRTNTIKGLMTTTAMLLTLFFLKGSTHEYYILALMFSQAIIFVYCELHFMKNIKGSIFSFTTLKQSKHVFKIGFFVLLANFFRVLIGNIGQWIVQQFSNIEDFAQYSLAGSMLSVVLLVINAVSAVFYTVISKNKDQRKLSLIKNLLLVFGVWSGFAFFILYEFITRFIPSYIPSLEYMRYLILSVPYLMVINVIATNLYKTTMDEKKYFAHMFFVLIITSGLIIGLYTFYSNPNAAAIGTTVVYFVWYYVSTNITFPYLKNSMPYNLLLISHLVIYLLLTSVVGNLIGAVAYIIYCLALLFIFRKDFYSVWDYVKGSRQEEPCQN